MKRNHATIAALLGVLALGGIASGQRATPATTGTLSCTEQRERCYQQANTPAQRTMCAAAAASCALSGRAPTPPATSTDAGSASPTPSSDGGIVSPFNGVTEGAIETRQGPIVLGTSEPARRTPCNARPATGLHAIVTPGRATVTGALTLQTVDPVLQQSLRAVSQCYRTQLRTTPGFTGCGRLRAIVGSNGAVLSAAVSEQSFTEPEFVSCLVSVAHSLRFPASPTGGSSTIQLPLVFEAR